MTKLSQPVPLFIPPLGTKIELAEPWSFELYVEYRNASLFETMGLKMPNRWASPDREASVNVTLVPGTILTVDRIYIRKGAKSFDSVSFFMKAPEVKKAIRFWAKLVDVNRIMMSAIT
jgi:hypothetical protein